MMFPRRFALGLIVATLQMGTFVLGPAGSYGSDEPLSRSAAPAVEDDASDYYELFSVLVDTIDQVERNYVEPIDRRELLEAAIQGVLAKLDPYSSYIRPDELAEFQDEVESKFGGIGIQITVDQGQLKVLSPLVGTPAYRAGLRAGDRIVKIDGESTDGITIDTAVKRLKGEADTDVRLTIVHEGQSEPVEVSIRREVIAIPTVLGERRKADGQWEYMLDPEAKIGYVRVTAFSRETAAELRRALEDLTTRGLKGLVLDLRFNPGGLLSSAIAVSDLFVAAGRIVSTEGRNSKSRSWEAHRQGTFEGFPMAVLVNRYSASASEIVAACLQDHGRAKIIGERTWGKGSVQNVIELEGGKSALKLTTAGYLRPSGANIHRFPDAGPDDEWGVRPDPGYEIKLNNAELAALILARRRRDIVPAPPAATEGAAPEKADSLDSSSSSAPRTGDGASPGGGGSGEEPTTNKETRPEIPPSSETESESSAEDAATHGSDAFVDQQLQKAVEFLKQAIAEQAPAEQPAAADQSE